METKNDSKETNQEWSLDDARREASEFLKINLEEPKQERRIEALQKLYEKYSSQINVRSFIYRDSIEIFCKLIDIYKQKQQMLEEVKLLDESFSVVKMKLENINYRFSEPIKDLEEKINFNKELLVSYEHKYLKSREITLNHKKYLKKLENVCWENWLRALDVNKELTNTIIGFENRKSLTEISKLYVDYYLFVKSEIFKCFESLKQMKEDGIRLYYEILRKYQLPLDKKMDFKSFLQKKIESKLSDSAIIKSLFGDFAESQRKQLDDSIEQIKNQYERDQQDVMSVVNFYKNFLLQKKVLFTNESEQLVIYFKKRYLEKIDLLCSRFQIHSSEMNFANKRIEQKDLNLLKKLIEEEFQTHLNNLKMDYSKQFIPILDNFWHLEQSMAKKYALDEEALIDKFTELKSFKKINLEHLISKFEEEKQRIKVFFDKKISIMESMTDFGVSEFDEILGELKEECDVVCCEVINLNARFWTVATAEFNCVVRRIFINLRHQYAPYINSWRAESKSWMHDYLNTNLNQELLNAAADALSGFSPESELYKNASKALLHFNEMMRKISIRRDDVEKQQLINLNTLPQANMESLLNEYQKQMDLLRDFRENFFNDYNNFYKSLLE